MKATTASLVLVGLVIACTGCGGRPPTENPSERYDLSKVPAPQADVPVSFEQRPNLELAQVDLGVPAGTPGEEDTIFIIRPDSQSIRPYSEKGAPCVFVAAAGPSLAGAGMSVEQMENYTELVGDGFVVVGYGTDGSVEPADSNAAFIRAHRKFASSMSGLVNARNAIEFALANLDIDPERLYAFGHSSGAKLALLLAAHEDRIKACVSVAGYANVVTSCSFLEASEYDELLPGWREYGKKASPQTHETYITCPVYLYHSRSDQVVPSRESSDMAERLRSQGRLVKLELTGPSSATHYGAIKDSRPFSWLADVDECLTSGRTLINARLVDNATELFEAAKIVLDESTRTDLITRYRLKEPTYDIQVINSSNLALTNDKVGFVQYSFHYLMPEIEPSTVIRSAKPWSLVAMPSRSTHTQAPVTCVLGQTPELGVFDLGGGVRLESITLSNSAGSSGQPLRVAKPDGYKNRDIFFSLCDDDAVNAIGRISDEDRSVDVQPLPPMDSPMNEVLAASDEFPYQIDVDSQPSGDSLPVLDPLLLLELRLRGYPANLQPVPARQAEQPVEGFVMPKAVLRIEGGKLTVANAAEETILEYPLLPEELTPSLDGLDLQRLPTPLFGDSSSSGCVGVGYGSSYVYVGFPKTLILIDRAKLTALIYQ